MNYLLREIMRRSFRRWREGDHVAWGIAAAAAFVLRRAMRDSPSHAFSIRRGESLLISPARPPRPRP